MQPFYEINGITLYNGDCLGVMPQLEARSFDAIICDLPYGTTACKWDSVIPFEPLWEQYKRLIKPNGAIVLFGSQPFTTDLIMSNRAWFRYCWVWNKKKATGHLRAKKEPLRLLEDIVIFCDGIPLYNPQMAKGESYRGTARTERAGGVYGFVGKAREDNPGVRYPKNLIEFSFEVEPAHPTQKPIALLEYLIRTYTNEGDTILDNTCGSGSLLVAARNTNRRAVGIETDEGYCRMAAGRLGRFEPSEFEVDKKAVEGQLGLFGAIACL